MTVGMHPLASVTERLIEEGYAVVPFPVDNLVQPVIDGWLRFVDQSYEEKKRFTVGDLLDPDDGYILRDGEQKHGNAGGTYDRKEFFHYTTGLVSLLARARVPFTCGAFSAWILRDLNAFYHECLRESRKYAEALELLFPGREVLRLFDEATKLHKHTLRLLCYMQPDTVGAAVAKPHTDRDFITFHLDESHRGLVCEKGGCKFTYEKQRNSVLIFGGRKAVRLTDGKIEALEHSVIATPETVGKRRWSAIFFSHLNLAP